MSTSKVTTGKPALANRSSQDLNELEKARIADDQGRKIPEHVQSSMLKSVVLITACTAAMVVNISNVTSVSIALPTIGKDLNIPEQRLQWLVSAYSLTSGCFLLLFGRLADLHGRKKVFIMGSLCLTVFSLGLGFSKNEITIDILRGFQGIGAAATIPSAIGILAHSFPPSRMRSIAFATFSAGAPTGGAVGLILGGVLTQDSKQTWRSNFYLATGLNAACLIMGLLSIDADPPSTETDKRIDWLGTFLVTAGLVLIVFVLSDGEIVGWTTSYIIALLVISVILLVLFVLWERYLEQVQQNPNAAYSMWTPPPLMKPSIWSRAKGRFAVIMSIAFLNWSSFLSWVFWVQLYYQDYLQLSPIHTMLRLIPMTATGILCNFTVAMVVGRVSLVNIVVIGTVLTGSASLLFALIKTSSPYWAFGFPAAITSVFGADFVFAAGTIFVAKVSLPHEQSLSGALFQTMTQIGTTFGLTISTIVFNKVVTRDSRHLGFSSTSSDTSAPRSAQLSGYRAALWTTFALALSCTLLAAVFLRGVGIVGHPSREEQEHKKLPESPQEADTIVS